MPPRKEKQETVGEGLSFLLYGLLGLFVLIFYFCLKGIFFNLIEDYFNLPIRATIFFSYQYGEKAAYLLITTIAFAVTYYLTRYCIKHNKISLNISPRIWILRLGVAIAFLSSFFDLGWIITNFFTGALEATGLLETLVTLILALLVFMFSFFELRAKALKTMSLVIVLVSVILINFTAIGIALYQAPPWQQKQMRQDLARFNKVNLIKGHIVQYYKRWSKLPENLNVLIRDLALTESEITDPDTHQPFGYRILSDQTFELCAQFNFDAKKARRINWWQKDLKFEQGYSCLKFLATQTYSDCEKRCIETCK